MEKKNKKSHSEQLVKRMLKPKGSESFKMHEDQSKAKAYKGPKIPKQKKTENEPKPEFASVYETAEERSARANEMRRHTLFNTKLQEKGQIQPLGGKEEQDAMRILLHNRHHPIQRISHRGKQ